MKIAKINGWTIKVQNGSFFFFKKSNVIKNIHVNTYEQAEAWAMAN